MKDDGSVAYANHRQGLAELRVRRWSQEVTRLEDRRDRMRSKGWRTRLTKQIRQAERALSRANADTDRWLMEAADREDRAEQAALQVADAGGEEYATEWEIGIDYEAANGPTHDVDVNIRLRRSDGSAFSYGEATRAMAALRVNIGLGKDDPAPMGYEIAGINWRSPGRASRGWRHGDWSSRGGLADVLYIASEIPDLWRVGGVE